MAPRKRKDSRGDTDKKANVVDSTPHTEAEEDKGGFAAFMPGGNHATKVQLAFLTFAAIGSCINLYLNPPDLTRFRDSYRSPLKWYDQFSDKYASLATTWGYTLPAKITERMHALHLEASVDVQEARVLEIGAGGGLIGIELQRLGYRHITGLDVSPKMAAAQSGGTEAYEMFLTADAETVPMDIKNGSLEVVLCVSTSAYLARGTRGGEQDLNRHFDGKELPPDRTRVSLLLEEWLRVLKAGGMLGLTVESHLAEVWEEVLKQLVASARMTELEVHDGLSAFPFHKDKEIKEAKTRLHFYGKLP